MDSVWSNSNDEHESPSSMSLDPLSGFEAFCWRTQASLCTQTAELDGLGTFSTTPNTFPRPITPSSFRGMRHRVMKGGRAFQSASIDVWISRSNPQFRHRLFTEMNKRTGCVEYRKESVGVSMKLLPQNPAAPALRADVHYFQIGGGCVSWWFSGTADLSLGPAAAPNAFSADVTPFLQTWQDLCSRYRINQKEAHSKFLDECFVMGEDAPVARTDRDTAFSFITDMVDKLLPAYLPLLDQASFKGDNAMFHHSDMISDIDLFGGLEDEEIEQFCISGGAACESTTVKALPFGSWRFSIAPSTLTAAGKVYDSLRNEWPSEPETNVFYGI